MYLYPFFLDRCTDRDTILKSIAPTIQEKGSSSNEIILHKVSKINGSERTLEKTTAHLHCLQGLRALFWELFG